MSCSLKTNDTQWNGDIIHQLLLIGLAIVAACLALAAVLPAWTVRSLVAVAFILQISHELKRGDYAFLKSPVFLLSAAACFGYSLYISIARFILLQDFMGDVSFIRVAEIIWLTNQYSYIGLKAEMYVLAFAMFGLSLHIVTGILEAARVFDIKSIPLSSKLVAPLTAASLVLTLVGLGANYFDFADGAVSRFLSGAYPPVQAFMIILLLHFMLITKTKYICFWIAALTAISFLLINYNAKIPVFIIVSIISYYVFTYKLNSIKIAKYIIILILLFIVLIEISQILRTRDSSILHGTNTTVAPEISMTLDVIISKTFLRQFATGNCFQNVVNLHENDTFEWQKQLFWIRALIPRKIWPGKENLSLGSSYSTKYCGDPVKTSHSASITLLGQPMIMGGNWGLILHGGILLMGLGALTLITRRYPGLGTVYVMALLPWWIDFDQDFALYVANAIKFSLFMFVVGVPIMLVQQPIKIQNSDQT